MKALPPNPEMEAALSALEQAYHYTIPTYIQEGAPAGALPPIALPARPTDPVWAAFYDSTLVPLINQYNQLAAV